jgi:thiol-disulfide isomerase/thioredoxin
MRFRFALFGLAGCLAWGGCAPPATPEGGSPTAAQPPVAPPSLSQPAPTATAQQPEASAPASPATGATATASVPASAAASAAAPSSQPASDNRAQVASDVAHAAAQPAVETDVLTIGSPAPALDIEHWLSDGRGTFKPVTAFEKDKVYVVEFWATWCGPCIQAMPHLAQTQREYANRGVQMITVSDEELDTVQAFLQRPLPAGAAAASGDPDAQTYGELTSVYSLTTDPDGSSYEAYMEAARQGGIPTAFVVGKTGLIEWIGHPMEMDPVLAAVVGDSWDRDGYRSQFQQQQAAVLAMEKLREALSLRKFDEAVTLIEQRLQSPLEPQEVFQLQMTKLQILMVQDKLEEAQQHLEACYANAAGDTNMIDALSWHIYEQSEQRQAALRPLLSVAEKHASAALDQATGEARGSLLDTLAHVTYKLGNRDRAIELSREAVAASSGQNQQFSQQFLDQLLAEKEAAPNDPPPQE